MDRLPKVLSLFLLLSLIFVLILYRFTNSKPQTLPFDRKFKENYTTCVGAKQNGSYIAADNHGRLGNHMFIYAVLYSMGRKTGRIPYTCGSYNLSVLFPNLTIGFHQQRSCAKGTKLRPKGTLELTQAHSPLYYDPTLLQRIKTSNRTHIFICCYLQNIAFFVDFLQEIKKEFSLAHSQRLKANVYLQKQLQKYKTSVRPAPVITENVQFVGIHIRRTDMLTHAPGQKFPNASYFENAMHYFRSKYKGGVLFIVSSDDLRWCRKNIRGPDVVFTGDSGQKSMEDDFSIQISCHHSIISVGTFGWWIGFLSKGEVLVFRDWAGTSKYAKWYLPGQRYPVGWKLMWRGCAHGI